MCLGALLTTPNYAAETVKSSAKDTNKQGTIEAKKLPPEIERKKFLESIEEQKRKKSLGYP